MSNDFSRSPSGGTEILGAACGGVIGWCGGWVGGVAILFHYFHYSFSFPWLWGWLTKEPGGVVVPIPHHPVLSYLPPLLGAAGLTLGTFAGFWMFYRAYEIHIRGACWSTPSQIKKAMRKGMRRGEALGAPVATIPIPLSLEVRHILLIGASGGGKTTVLWPILHAAQERGDKMLIFSFKGDFQEKWDGPFTLLAPWDQRSARWRLGADINRDSDAQSLAETLIKTSEKEPMWGQAAQALLVAVIRSVQREYGEDWSAQDIAYKLVQALSKFSVLKATIQKEYPMASMLLAGGPTDKSVKSFLINLITAVIPIVNLGVADFCAGSQDSQHSWSVRDWLSGHTPPAAIFGYQSSNETMSNSWGASIVEQVVRQLADMPDASPSGRRIWLVLDEVPQLGKIPSITKALEVLRSKGVRVVLGMQSLAQTRKVYDRDTAQIWEGQCGTTIITQLKSTEEKTWASKIVGEREIERFTRALNSNSDGPGQRNESYQRLKEPLLMPEQFDTDLVTTKRGVRVVFAQGPHRVMTRVPIFFGRKQREMTVDADWTKPGYQRPDWGQVPPKGPREVFGDDDNADADTNKSPKGDKGLAEPKRRKSKRETAQRHSDDALLLPVAGVAVKKQATETQEQECPGDDALDTVLGHMVPVPVGHVLELAKAILEGTGVSVPTSWEPRIRQAPAQTTQAQHGLDDLPPNHSEQDLEEIDDKARER